MEKETLPFLIILDIYENVSPSSEKRYGVDSTQFEGAAEWLLENNLIKDVFYADDKPQLNGAGLTNAGAERVNAVNEVVMGVLEEIDEGSRPERGKHQSSKDHWVTAAAFLKDTGKLDNVEISRGGRDVATVVHYNKPIMTDEGKRYLVQNK
ncbi:hypothetical protein [Salibacterium aidingense]|uniref:hypothetical protein n=1 Tax=Salibacterium aidingense TaxID=384933 RepID=UPI000410FC09|nr:hypothetical protein [Salibacterium aidingense]